MYAQCETCDRTFIHQMAAEQHMDALDHWAHWDHWGGPFECDMCSGCFETEYDFQSHMDDHYQRNPKFPCDYDSCQLLFHTQMDANRHMDEAGHWEPQVVCQTCPRLFVDHYSAAQHMNALGHWKLRMTWETPKPRYEMPQIKCETPDIECKMPRIKSEVLDIKCEICDQRFHTQQAVNQHMGAARHYSALYCHECQRGFQDQNSLNMHLNSNVHRGTNITCSFCRMCFSTASGLAHHLETSSCPSARNLNREAIHSVVSQRYTTSLFTKKLLTSGYEPENVATGAAWNGHFFECYLCHQLHHTLIALNQHLRSSVHGQKLYHCPNRTCRREFISMGAMFNHLESETCGYMRFEKVQEKVQNIITGHQKLIGSA